MFLDDSMTTGLDCNETTGATMDFKVDDVGVDESDSGSEKYILHGNLPPCVEYYAFEVKSKTTTDQQG